MATSRQRGDERLLIGGEWVERPAAPAYVTNPANGEIVGTVPEAPRRRRAAIDAAAAALEGWRTRPPSSARAACYRRAADVMRERVAEIGADDDGQQGKPLAEATARSTYAAGFFEWFAGEAERIYGADRAADEGEERVLVLRQAVGVIAAITPWNFPAAMMTRKLGPAHGRRLHQHRQAGLARRR